MRCQRMYEHFWRELLNKKFMKGRPKQVNPGPGKRRANAFKRMHLNGDDKLLIPAIFEDEKLEKWNNSAI